MNNILDIVRTINEVLLGGSEKNIGVANLPKTSAVVKAVIIAI